MDALNWIFLQQIVLLQFFKRKYIVFKLIYSCRKSHMHLVTIFTSCIMKVLFQNWFPWISLQAGWRSSWLFSFRWLCGGGGGETARSLVRQLICRQRSSSSCIQTHSFVVERPAERCYMCECVLHDVLIAPCEWNRKPKNLADIPSPESPIIRDAHQAHRESH